jgi:beta-lactamase class A
MYARSTRRKSGRLIKKKEETPRGRIELDSKIDLTENDTHTNSQVSNPAVPKTASRRSLRDAFASR